MEWQYDTPYRLKLTLGNKRIRGSLADTEGKELAAIAFKLDNRAVAAGRPALTCNGFQAAFDDVAMTCSQTVPAPEKERWMPPPYTQAGRVPLPDEPKGRATGFFHVEQHDGCWWCIDPRGRPFFILGTDHARYSGHWCEALGYAPYHRNMQETFENEEAWAKSTAERLRAWGFNTVAAGHSESLRNRGLAWTAFIGFGARFPSISDLCPKVHWTGFPNVFHPRFPAWCERLAEEHCARYKDDPWLLGYFLDNELEWYGKEHREWSLVDVHNKPYERLVEAASALQPKVYDIHAGHVPELSVTLEWTEPREDGAPRTLAAVVSNTGKADAKTEMEITVNGKSRRQPVVVPAGETIRAPVDRAAERIDDPPTALVRVSVDPDGTLGEVEREDNTASVTHVDWEQARAPLEAMKKGRPRWVVPVAIVNASESAVEESAIAVRLADLPDAAAIERGARRAFQLPGNAKGAVVQLDRLPFGSEVAVPVRRAEPLSASAMGLGFAEDEKGDGGTDQPPVRFKRGKGKWQVDNGVLQLIKEKPGGNAFDRVLLRGKDLGFFLPVIWQNVGQDLWPRPDSARLAGASNGPVRLVLDIEFELTPESPQKVLTAVDDQGEHAAAARRLGAFKTAYRFTVYPGKPWVGVRFLWIENTDTRPWDFRAYFHYALSRLAGDASDDVVGGPQVPNYYARDRAVTWFDPQAKLHYGIAQGRDADLQMHFWTDPGGGQHADVRREIKVTLQPGQRWPPAAKR